MKKIIIQECPIVEKDILVIVGGVKVEDAITFLKKEKVKKDFIEWLKDDYDNIIADSNNVGKVVSSELGCILSLQDYSNDWEHIDILLHEVVHVVQYIAEICSFENEREFNAYLTEYLFKELRRALNKEE